MANGRKTGGRQAGTLNRRTTEQAAALEASGLSPLEYLVSLYRDEGADPKDRAWAANAVAPFLHARRAPAQQVVQLDLPDTSTVEGVSAAIAAVVKAVAGGVIAPGEGQSLVAIMEVQRKAIETSEMLDRIEALEAAAERVGGRAA